MKRRSYESEKDDIKDQEYSVEYIDTESEKEEIKDRAYSVDYIDTDTESEKDKYSDGEGDIDTESEKDKDDDVDKDNVSSDADKDSNSSGCESNHSDEPRVVATLGEIIADLDSCEAGTAFLNMLEMYLTFMLLLYIFALISK